LFFPLGGGDPFFFSSKGREKAKGIHPGQVTRKTRLAPSNRKMGEKNLALWKERSEGGFRLFINEGILHKKKEKSTASAGYGKEVSPTCSTGREIHEGRMLPSSGNMKELSEGLGLAIHSMVWRGTGSIL